MKPNGADGIRDMIAQIRSPSCYANRGVEVRPGFIATARDAINVRFDSYEGPMNSAKISCALRELKWC